MKKPDAKYVNAQNLKYVLYVKPCKDGSFVSRDPENDCKFPDCPAYYWAQYLGDNTKCEPTHEREAKGFTYEECMQKAEDSGFMYFSYVEEQQVCFASETCDRPKENTGWDWKVYMKVMHEEQEGMCIGGEHEYDDVKLMWDDMDMGEMEKDCGEGFDGTYKIVCGEDGAVDMKDFMCRKKYDYVEEDWDRSDCEAKCGIDSKPGTKATRYVDCYDYFGEPADAEMCSDKALPDMEKECGVRECVKYWVEEGCSTERDANGADDHAKQELLENEKSNVFCCDDEANTCTTAVRNGKCSGLVDFVDAMAMCKAMGLNICTMEQLDAGICCGRGCNANNKLTWSRDQV